MKPYWMKSVLSRDSLQVEQAFGTEVEDEVDDGEVGEKAVLVGENLIIGRTFGYVRMSFCFLEILGAMDFRLQVDEFAAFFYQTFVQVQQKGPFLLVDGAEVVLQVFKKGGVVVAGFQGIPVLVLPVLMIADAHVLHQALSTHQEIAFIHRYGELQRPVRSVDDTAVSQGLLVEMFVLLNIAWFARTKLGEP